MRKIRVAFALIALICIVLPAQAVVTANYNNSSDVPVTSNGYVATGETVNFSLNYAPQVGTELMVVNNTALDFISGTFDNLAQNQTVTLSYGGIPYEFVANYYGGSGNDLVLVWKSNRLFGWGRNAQGQLSDGTIDQRNVATPMLGSELLGGKTVVSVSTGVAHTLALCSDGTLWAWGSNLWGQLGDNTGVDSLTPVAVSTEVGVSALYGKTVVAISVGSAHNLALCSDGTVAAWGFNDYGNLGSNDSVHRFAPIAVNTEMGVSALYGKKVVAISAGGDNSLVLCSDGTMAEWGRITVPLNNEVSDRYVPVAVNMESGISALHGKSVVAISAGSYYSLALSSDGKVFAWGTNGGAGALGINSSLIRSELAPVAVNAESGISALFGKTVVAISAGYFRSLALCSDGTVAAWGNNEYGQVGDNTSTHRFAPVLVNTASGVSALHGKTVVAISGGSEHSLALCSDGALVAWGRNDYDQLGANPSGWESLLLVNTAQFAVGERLVRLSSKDSGHHNMVIVAAAHHEIAVFDGTGTGGVERQSGESVSFVATDIGISSSAQTFTIQNSGAPGALTGISVSVTGTHSDDFVVSRPAITLQPSGTTTFTVTFRPTGGGSRQAVVQIASNDTNEAPFTIPVNGVGRYINLNANYLYQTFVPLTVPAFTATGNTVSLQLFYAPAVGMQMTVVKNTGDSPIQGTFSGLAHGQIVTLSYGGVDYDFSVDYHGGTGNDLVLDGVNKFLDAVYTTGKETPVVSYGTNAVGNTVNFTLNHTPAAGAELMVVKNYRNFTKGNFDNLENGESVVLDYAGISYEFVADYYGGNGNDLVLRWKDRRLFSWGYNNRGQLGNNTTTQSAVAVPVTATGVLADKTIISVASGSNHSLALCSDGTVAAWGENSDGRLGDNTFTNRLTPVAVYTANGSALHGKTVIAVSAGSNHSLALCSDGTIAAWGSNGDGQLGIRSWTSRRFPVAVNTEKGISALYGKTVTAVSAGSIHSLALCSDQTVVAWGNNNYGQLGDNTTSSHSVAVAVDNSYFSALYQMGVTAISAGENHSLAICLDGSVAAWGTDTLGQLGNSHEASHLIPVSVYNTGMQHGKTVVEISAGRNHSLALCANGDLLAWGANTHGRLGDNSTTQRNAPIHVNKELGVSALHGKTVISISAGGEHSLALCSDGTLAAWGRNTNGRLGDNTTTNRLVPVAVNSTPLATGERFAQFSRGSLAAHSMVLVAAAHHEIAVFDGDGTGGAQRQSGVGNFGFAATEVGLSSSAQAYTIQNTGTLGALTGIGVTVAGSHPGDFVLTAPSVASLNPNGTTTFTVTFTPTGIGARSAVVRITSNDTDENPFLIAVTGIASAPLASWRSLHFGTSANTGNGANDFDFDHDGLVNLIEYAFGQNPTLGTSAQLPQVQRNGSELVYSFTAPDHVVGITYSAEWSATLGENDWHVIPDTGIAPQHQFSVDSAPDTKMFIRFRITAP